MKNKIKYILGFVLVGFLVSVTVFGATLLFPTGGGTGVGTISGIIKGNGTAPFSTAIPGVDYLSSAVNKTYAELTSMVSGSTLLPNQLYFISDKNIYITAISTNQFASDGFYRYTSGRKAWGAIKLSSGFGGTTNVSSIKVNGVEILGRTVDYVTETESWSDRATHPYTIDVSFSKLIERIVYFINHHQSDYTAYANANYIIIESNTVGTNPNGFLVTGTATGLTLGSAITFSNGSPNIATAKIFNIEYDFTADNITSIYDPVYNNKIKQSLAFQSEIKYTNAYYNFIWDNEFERMQINGDVTAEITEGMQLYLVGISNEIIVNGEPVYDSESDVTNINIYYGGETPVSGVLYKIVIGSNGNTILDFNWNDDRVTHNDFSDVLIYKNFLSADSFINDNEIKNGVFGLNVLQSASGVSFNKGRYAEIFSNDLLNADNIQYNTLVGGVHRSGSEYMSKINWNYMSGINNIGSNQMLGGSWIMNNNLNGGSQIESLTMLSTGNVVKNSFTSTFFASMSMDDRASFTNNTFAGSTLFYSSTFKDDCFFNNNTLTGVFFADHTITAWDINNSTLTNVLWEQDFSNNLYWDGEVLVGSPSGATSGLILSIENAMARSIQYGTRVKFTGSAGTGQVNDVIHLGQIRKGNAFETVFLYATSLVGTGASIKIGITSDDDCILQSTTIASIENGTRPVAIPLKFPNADNESIILTVTGATITSGTLYARMEGIFTQSADSVSTNAVIPFTVGSGTPTTASGGMRFGSDTVANFYRSASGAITTDGKFGLGMIPTHKLDVTQTTDSQGFRLLRGSDSLRLDIDSSGYPSIITTKTLSLPNIATGNPFRFNNNILLSFGLASDYSIGYHSTSDTLQFIDGATIDSNVRLAINSSGYVGVGTGSTIPNLFTTGGNTGTIQIGTSGAIHPLLLRNTDSGGLIINTDANVNADNLLEVQENGTVRMVIDNAGKVGIGTDTPTNLLTVNGDIKVSSASAYIYNNNFYPLSSTSNMKIETGTGYLSFFTNSSEKMRLLNTGEFGIGTTTPTTTFSVKEKSGNSDIGGIMIKLTNKTGANSVKGTVVYADPDVDNAFEINPIDGDMPIGVVYDNGIADGSECWVVVSGIAEVLLVDTVATTRSYVAYSSSTTAGRIDTASTVPAALVHFREIGHTLESKGAGTNVLVKTVLHFN